MTLGNFSFIPANEGQVLTDVVETLRDSVLRSVDYKVG